MCLTYIVQSSLKSTNDSSKFVKTYEQKRFPHPQLWNKSWILEYPTSVNLY